MLLVHPTLINIAKNAIAKSGLKNLKVFVFSDRETGVVDSIPDWRSILGTPEQGENWDWKKLSPQKAKTTIAAINFSSGFVLLLS